MCGRDGNLSGVVVCAWKRRLLEWCVWKRRRVWVEKMVIKVVYVGKG